MTAPTAQPPSAAPAVRLVEMGERRIVAEMLEPRYRAVPSFGDDCAALGLDRVITTDSCGTALVAGLGEEDPVHTGWLLATINLSDLAAAGAEPEGLVVNYTLRPDTPVDTLRRIMDGVDACAESHGTRVLGGDIGEGREMRLSATAVGLRPQAHGEVSRLGRRGAAAGDRLLLVGSPGWLWGAALIHHGFAQVPAADRATVFDHACRPTAQLRAGQLLARAGLARSATDISDGLYASVRSLCRANGLGALVDPGLELDDILRRVCEQAEVHPFQLGQTWGDWCLLVAVHPDRADDAQDLLLRDGIAVQDIGAFTAEPGSVRIDDGSAEPPAWDGIDQERFSSTSWRGDGIAGALQRMRQLSRGPQVGAPPADFG
jgi:thiamine-monophosphate kinase